MYKRQLLLTLVGMIFEEQLGIKLCVIGCIGALALMITGVISEKDALASIDLKTIFLFGGTLSLAAALAVSYTHLSKHQSSFWRDYR